MQKKLTITTDEQVYLGLHSVIGRHRVGRFIESVLRPWVVQPDVLTAYRTIASDEQRESAGLEWCEY